MAIAIFSIQHSPTYGGGEWSEDRYLDCVFLDDKKGLEYYDKLLKNKSRYIDYEYESVTIMDESND